MNGSWRNATRQIAYSRLLTITALLAAAACGGRSFDWRPTERALRVSLADSTSKEGVFRTLDSLGFTYVQRDSVIIALKRQPRANGDLIYSSFQVSALLSSSGRLKSFRTRQLLTGP